MNPRWLGRLLIGGGPAHPACMKSQTPSLANAAGVAWRRSFRFLMALAMVIAARTPAWCADVIYLESNSTTANSVFAFKFDELYDVRRIQKWSANSDPGVHSVCGLRQFALSGAHSLSWVRRVRSGFSRWAYRWKPRESQWWEHTS